MTKDPDKLPKIDLSNAHFGCLCDAHKNCDPKKCWAKRFDEEFVTPDGKFIKSFPDNPEDTGYLSYRAHHIKTFIADLLSNVRKDLAQRVEQCLDGEDCYETPEDERKEVLRILREEADL